MAIAIDPHEEFDFILPSDRELDPPKRTTWRLRMLTVSQRAKLEDMQAQGVFDSHGDVAGFNYHAGTMRLEVVRAGLVGCENLQDPAGNVVPYEANKLATVLGKRSPQSPTDEFLERIAPADLEELAAAIQAGARMTAAEGNG